MKLVNPHSGSAAVQRAANELMLVLLRELEVFGERNGRPDWPMMDVVGFRQYGIPYRPSVWFDECSPAERMLCSRAARYLEETRRMERITNGGRDRVRFVIFTTRGFKQALDAAAEKVSRDAVIRGLELTDWGGFLIESLEPLNIDEFDGQLIPIDWVTNRDFPADESLDPSAD